MGYDADPNVSVAYRTLMRNGFALEPFPAEKRYRELSARSPSLGKVWR
jgi:hypothetical protein